MDDGIYTSVLVQGYKELAEDKFIQELSENLFDLYDEFLTSQEGSGVDNDTSCEIRVSGEMIKGTFSPSKMSLEFSFLDEMNHAVCQTLAADFLTGDITIIDDDTGCIYKDNDESYILYG